MVIPANWKILFIDDEPDIRDVVSMDLMDAGYTVLTAADGVKGLEICDLERPQIVITDIRMPKMDGLSVLASIKEKYPDIQVIVVTAFGEIDVAVRALQLDASDFISKPISPDALHVAMKRARDRYSQLSALSDYTTLLQNENARTAAELSRTIAFQKDLIRCSMDGIVGCDEQDTIVIFNDSMQKMLGYRSEDVLHKLKIDAVFADGMYEPFRAALDSESRGRAGQLFLFETLLKSGNGSTMQVQVSAVVLPEAVGSRGLVCFFRDLREIRRLEQQMADQARLLHQDKMLSLGRLAASVVHEINNPLSGILNYMRLMMRIVNRGNIDREQQDKFRQYLDLVTTETDRCSRIVSSLLLFSRKQEPLFEPVDLLALINRCVVLCGHKLELNQIEWKLSLPEGLPLVTADGSQLHQCLINLILNAVDAMPKGGELFLSARHEKQPDSIVVEVRDTGVGIDAEDIPHIFDPFFTTKQSGYGVGLGLSTAYGIVERHDGTITVGSRPGKGTKFLIRLPIKPPG
ncbi:MAG: response regulator [Desulfobacterales bacterium]